MTNSSNGVKRGGCCREALMSQSYGGCCSHTLQASMGNVGFPCRLQKAG